MALADPVVLAFTGGTVNLPRVSSGDGTSTYRTLNEDGGFQEVKIIHTRGKRNRHIVRLESSTLTEDPVTETNFIQSCVCTITLDSPQVGFSSADRVDFAKTLMNWLLASTAAKLVAIDGGES